MNGFIKILFAAIVSLVVVTPAFPGPVILDENLQKISLGLHLEYMEDPGGKISIQDITAGRRGYRWTRSDDKYPGFGYTDSAYWVRLTPENRTKAAMEYYLEVAYPFLDSIRLYVPEHNAFRMIEAGFNRPFRERPYKHYNFVFPLTIQARASDTVYLRFQTRSSMHMPLYIWSPAAFRDYNYLVSIFLWMFYGIMMIMAVYNFFIFLSIRDRAYVFYILYIISFGLFLMSLQGIAYQYLWPNATWWAWMSIPFFVGIVNFSIVRFAMRYINVWQYIKTTFDRSMVLLLGFMAYSGIALSVLSLFWHNFAFGAAASAIITCFNVTVGSVLVVMGIARYRSRETWFFAAGFLICMIFCIMYAFMELNIITQLPLDTIGLHIGGVINVSLLSFALADKINVMRRDLLDLNRHLEKKLKRCNKSHLKGVDVDEKVSMLKNLMEVDKIYRDEELPMKILAYEMSMTVHQLSELLNNKLNTSFNNFINGYRVEEAKELLLNNPERSVSSIASDVGFGSITNFFRIFKKLTGFTPKEFRARGMTADVGPI
ncbi:MAG: helix-turn-helix domain-containing protein [Spirochaetes bacterium]|nr:helix-turn-helix domain-containing protein [Spirochaetota bacterium]